jgi:hypothetical protein
MGLPSGPILLRLRPLWYSGPAFPPTGIAIAALRVSRTGSCLQIALYLLPMTNTTYMLWPFSFILSGGEVNPIQLRHLAPNIVAYRRKVQFKIVSLSQAEQCSESSLESPEIISVNPLRRCGLSMSR